ncbi:MAG: hypothetical protein WCP86_02820 [bacterium]
MSNLTTIVCDGCNTNLELEGSYQEWAGHEIECPSCGHKLVVEAPKVTATSTAGARKCPGCGVQMGAGAVLCVACGFDTRTGKKISGL